MSSDEPPRFLLLLPPVSTPASTAALRATYGETISEVLKEVALHSSESSKAAVLEIALACPHLINCRTQPRSSLYEQTHSLVAGLYKLLVVIAAQESVNVEDADGVDVRVILVAWSPESKPQRSTESAYGPIIDIRTLAGSGRQWQFAFGVESDVGGSMVQDFVAAKSDSSVVAEEKSESVQGSGDGPTTFSASQSNSAALATSGVQKHYDVAVGGTWDHLHIGHKLLITMTLFIVDEVQNEERERTAVIGITGDQLLVNKKHASLVESWADRQKAVATFFNAIIDFSQPTARGQRHVSVSDDPVPNGKSLDVHYPNDLIVKCTEIQDPFGPTITVQAISALVISAETRSGGKAVNDKRKEQGWKGLEIFEVDVLDAEDDDKAEIKAKEDFDSKLSSTAIRAKLASKLQGPA